MKLTKKIIAVVLGIIMILSCVTVVCFADGEKNTFTVTFNANEGVCNESSREVEKNAVIGELPVPEDREGYTFAGWFDNATYGEGTEYTSESVISEDVTLYAQWSDGETSETSSLSIFSSFFARLGELLEMAFSFLAHFFGGTGTSDFLAVK